MHNDVANGTDSCSANSYPRASWNPSNSWIHGSSEGVQSRAIPAPLASRPEEVLAESCALTDLKARVSPAVVRVQHKVGWFQAFARLRKQVG
eukprot:742665-Amphidinium_carterae.1